MDKKRRIEHYKNLIADIDKQIIKNRDYEKILDLSSSHLQSIDPMLNGFSFDTAVFPIEKPFGVIEDNKYYMGELDHIAVSFVSLNILLDDISDALLHIVDELEE